ALRRLHSFPTRRSSDLLLLPVRNVLAGVADDEFYAPGSIFRLELDAAAPEARGMPAQSIAWYEGGPAFEVLDSSAVRVIGRYPRSEEHTSELQSRSDLV